MKFKLRWLLVRSFFSKKNKEFEPIAHEAAEKAREVAAEIINRQREFLLVECMDNPKLAEFVENEGEVLQISFELQFLWGVFHEHVKKYILPTEEYDRIRIHLMDWLVTFRGYKLEEAVEVVQDTASLYNKCDPLFEAISEAGKRSYTNPDDAFLAKVCKVFMEQRKSA